MGLYEHKRLAKKLEKTGRRAKAEVTRMVQEGSYDSDRYADDADIKAHGHFNYHLTLQVMPEGEAPFEAEARTRLYRFPRHGQVFDVLYDPTDHGKIVVDYEGDADEYIAERDANPEASRERMKTLQAMMESAKALTPDQQRERALAQQARLAGGSAPGKADEIAKLADLRDRGALTTEEFEKQKAALLDQI
jgi:hypothetical protein